MKLSTFLLGGSLVANAALLALLVAGTSGGNSSSSAPGGTSAPLTTASAPTGSDPNSNSTVDPAAWSHLKPEDPVALRDRLRAEGFPPAMIRALVAEQVRVQFAPRRAALNLKANERPFWEPTTPDPKTAAALAQIMKEQNQALKDVLGPDAMLDDAQATNLRRQFPNLPDEKIAAILRSQQDLNEKFSALIASLGGSLTTVDMQQYTALQKSQQTEIAKLLTPQEFQDYELRTGNTANSLRRQLVAFEPTEQEFRTLYQLQKPFDDQYQLSIVGTITDEQRQLMTQRAEAQKQLAEQIKAALGDQRYAEYQRSIDNNYQQTSKLVARLELPPETANQVYVVQQDLQQRLRTLQTDRALTPEDRNAQLAALNAEAESKVTSVLGPRGYEAYKQYGGSWLQQLQPRPVAPARPAVGAGGGRGGG